MSLDEPEPVDSVLMFLSGYDTLEYSWVKATAVFVRLRILFMTLQNTNNDWLPSTSQKHDSIWAIVDRLTKTTHHLRVPTIYTSKKCVETYLDHTVVYIAYQR